MKRGDHTLIMTVIIIAQPKNTNLLKVVKYLQYTHGFQIRQVVVCPIWNQTSIGIFWVLRNFCRSRYQKNKAKLYHGFLMYFTPFAFLKYFSLCTIIIFMFYPFANSRWFIIIDKKFDLHTQASPYSWPLELFLWIWSGFHGSGVATALGQHMENSVAIPPYKIKVWC